jgi:hypothetical protein
MAEPFFTILTVLVFGASIILLVWAVFRALPSGSRRVARWFWCPFRDCNVTAEFREKPWDGTRIDVSRCTAFTPPEAVNCAKLCLGLKKFPAPGRGAAELYITPNRGSIAPKAHP